MNDYSYLFHKFIHHNIQLPNRIVMPPMTRSSSHNHIPTQQVAEYYRRRAAHGVGLIITEGACIDHPAANGHTGIPFMFGEAALAGWKKVVDAVHAEGAKIIPQLWHVGGVRAAGSEPNPDIPAYSPSGLAAPENRSGLTMSQRDIQEVIESFTRAARNAKAVGFDGVELHGAHGYLIDQFFWPGTNRRDDEYGISFEGRTRFAKEIIQSIRCELGENFLIVFRWSQWKMQSLEASLVSTPIELEALLQPLVDAGVDIFHCSTRRYWEPAFCGSDLTLAGWTKKISGLPTIAVGSVGLQEDFLGSDSGANTLTTDYIMDDLIRRLEDEEFDLIAVGRALIADPAWPEKVRSGNIATVKPFDRSHLMDLQ
ncbi:MAG: NADH:flavin oxidoreductase [Candidatus Thiodiazotropha sp. L084R]